MTESLPHSERPKGWHSRGYLPHFDGGETCQFITIHLADAVPQAVLKRWKVTLDNEKDEAAKRVLRMRYEKYLDQGYGKCHLQNHSVAEIVQESLIHFDDIRYGLLAWAIMPNHVHFVMTPRQTWSVSVIIQKFKSYTSHEANKELGREGRFWQEDYFDRFIRDYKHFESTVAYVENNPVSARLCKKASDWRWGSARFLNTSTLKLELPKEGD